jgi:hypothetical protein
MNTTIPFLQFFSPVKHLRVAVSFGHLVHYGTKLERRNSTYCLLEIHGVIHWFLFHFLRNTADADKDLVAVVYSKYCRVIKVIIDRVWIRNRIY